MSKFRNSASTTQAINFRPKTIAAAWNVKKWCVPCSFIFAANHFTTHFFEQRITEHYIWVCVCVCVWMQCARSILENWPFNKRFNREIIINFLSLSLVFQLIFYLSPDFRTTEEKNWCRTKNKMSEFSMCLYVVALDKRNIHHRKRSNIRLR